MSRAIIRIGELRGDGPGDEGWGHGSALHARDAGKPGEVRSTTQVQPPGSSATAATIASLLVRPDLEERRPALGQDVGQDREQPPDDGEAVLPAIERVARLERGRDRQVGPCASDRT